MSDDGAPDSRREGPADRLLAAGRGVTVTLALLVGATIGLLGTVVHRAAPPWGLLLALGAALSGGVLARSLAAGLGVAAHVGGLLLVTQLATTLRPGGDVLVVDDPLGYVWLYGSVLAGAAATFLPARWFAATRAGEP